MNVFLFVGAFNIVLGLQKFLHDVVWPGFLCIYFPQVFLSISDLYMTTLHESGIFYLLFLNLFLTNTPIPFELQLLDTVLQTIKSLFAYFKTFLSVF
jgi:hypothetical protein